MIRIAIVGFPVDYYQPVQQALIDAGHEVLWIPYCRSDRHRLMRHGTPSELILDPQTWLKGSLEASELMRVLGQLERESGPMVNDLILMDRILRRHPFEVARSVVARMGHSIREFLQSREVSLVFSGRDSALQLTTMLMSKALGVPWVAPTRLRIPKDFYGYTLGHEMTDFVQLREVSLEDQVWASRFLAEFRGAAIRPALKKSTRSWADVVRLLPDHARVFLDAVRRARFDRGNAFSRYSVPALIRMYFRRRFRLFRYRISTPAEGPRAEERFGLLGLHTQPESSIDVAGSMFSDQVALVRQIARGMPSGVRLYVKVHPTDVDGQALAYYQSLSTIPGVRLIDFQHDSRDLLGRAEVVFTLTGTMGYEAALLGKPVLTFANNYFNAFPTVVRVEDMLELPRLISSALGGDDKSTGRDAQIENELARLRASCIHGEFNRMFGPNSDGLTPEDLESFVWGIGAISNKICRTSFA